MKEKIEEKLRDIVLEVCSKQIDRNEITGKVSFIYDLGMDSVSMVKLLVEIEEQFGIEIVDGYTAIEKMADFESLVEYISSKGEN